MKNILIGFLFAGLIFGAVAAGIREDFYTHFGPKQAEALTTLTLNNINIVRTNAGLPAITTLQWAQQYTNILAGIPDYDAMGGNP